MIDANDGVDKAYEATQEPPQWRCDLCEDTGTRFDGAQCDCANADRFDPRSRYDRVSRSIAARGPMSSRQMIPTIADFAIGCVSGREDCLAKGRHAATHEILVRGQSVEKAPLYVCADRSRGATGSCTAVPLSNPPTTRDVFRELSTAAKTLAILDAVSDGRHCTLILSSDTHSEGAFRTWAGARCIAILSTDEELRLDVANWTIVMRLVSEVA